jgi:hypothetical protein
MKFFLFFFLLIHSIFGVYVGNLGAPSIMNTGFFSAHNPFIKGTTGYIADYVTDKHFVTSATDPLFDPNEAFKKFIIHSQMASFSLILLERLELFGAVGGSKPRTKLNVANPNLDLILDFTSSYQFSWSTGAKVVLIQWGQTYFCSDFTYFAMPESPHSYFKFFNRLNLPIDFSKKQELSLEEWQLSFGLSSRIFFLTPYVGGCMLSSKMFISSGPEVGSFNYKNENRFGYFYGVTLSLSGSFHVNFEQRFRSENAYTFSTVAVF